MGRFLEPGRYKKFITMLVVAALSVSAVSCSSSEEGEDTSVPAVDPLGTEVQQSAPTTIMLETVSTEPTSSPTPTQTPTPMPTLAPEERSVIVTFTGDCTLTQDYRSGNRLFDSTVDGDMEYCFQNCADMFKKDDLTLINLENPVTELTGHKDNQYIFRMKPENLEMLTLAGIEAVNIANNHTMDFWENGLQDTRDNLEEYGIIWSDSHYGATFTTESGIVIGMVGLDNDTNASDVSGIIRDLKDEGAAIIIASCHFGAEGVYEPTDRQKRIAKSLIDDYGVDIVVGTHPHRLQPIEKYNGHYIFYSLSNFCFGGNYSLSDPDSVIIQCEFIMDASGSECVDYRLKVYPYSQTSTRPGNDFCPKPYDWESEDYFRVMKRLEWAQGDE